MFEMVLKWYEMSISDVRFGYFVLLLLGFERFTQAKVVWKVYFILKGLSRVWKSSKSFQNHQIRSGPHFWMVYFEKELILSDFSQTRGLYLG